MLGEKDFFIVYITIRDLRLTQAPLSLFTSAKPLEGAFHPKLINRL